jgi:hypothetical protein
MKKSWVNRVIERALITAIGIQNSLIKAHNSKFIFRSAESTSIDYVEKKYLKFRIRISRSWGTRGLERFRFSLNMNLNNSYIVAK